jgi:hypothetical protein
MKRLCRNEVEEAMSELDPRFEPKPIPVDPGTNFMQHPDRWVAPRFRDRKPPLSNEALAALTAAAVAKGKPLTDAERKTILEKF